MRRRMLFCSLVAILVGAGSIASHAQTCAISLTGPTTGSAVKGKVTIEWSYADCEDGSADPTGLALLAHSDEVKVEVSSNGGTTWTQVGSPEPIGFEGTGSATWTTGGTAFPEGNYVIRLTELDYGETSTGGPVTVDNTAPTVVFLSSDYAETGGGYSNQAVVNATFQATDNLSGFAPDSALTKDVVVKVGEPDEDGNFENGEFSATSPAFTDRAGNVAAAGAATSPTFKLDRSASIDSQLSANPNGAEWNKTDVTVSWYCTDSLSGPSTELGTPATATFTAEGAGQTGSSTCGDLAGNTVEDTQTINIDKTAASASITSTDLTLGLRSAVRGVATDGLSGVKRVLVQFKNLDTGLEDLRPASCQGCGSIKANWNVSTLGLLPGEYEVSVRADDQADNDGAYSAPMTMIIP